MDERRYEALIYHDSIEVYDIDQHPPQKVAEFLFGFGSSFPFITHRLQQEGWQLIGTQYSLTMKCRKIPAKISN